MAPFDASATWPAAPAEPDHLPDRFKDALANLASGVAIISCWDGDMPTGLLVSSITGLSVDPPRFLFCVRKEAGCHDALLASVACGVTILSAQDEDEALRFCTPSRRDERFAPTRWNLQHSPAPTFNGGLSRAACRIDTRIDAGTHSILIVTAREVAVEPSAAPLVSHGRAFHALLA